MKSAADSLDDQAVPLLSPPAGWYPPVKRLLEVLVACLLSLALLPIGFAIVLLVRLTSKGPAIYRAKLVGWREQPFIMFKFRTMVENADRIGAWFTSDNDPRITTVGRFLRKTSLDELPQLINVIRGDMSLIGPRPAAFAQLAAYSTGQRQLRCSVRPGITGLAQINERSMSTVSQAIGNDLRYVANMSMSLDVLILVKTLRMVLTQRGTN